jgi:hypothetical protein
MSKRPGYWQLGFPLPAELANRLLDLFEYMYWLICDRAGREDASGTTPGVGKHSRKGPIENAFHRLDK